MACKDEERGWAEWYQVVTAQWEDTTVTPVTRGVMALFLVVDRKM